jgi:hypothetical protein
MSLSSGAHGFRDLYTVARELVARVGVSLARPSGMRRLSRVRIALPRCIGHFAQLSLQRVKNRILKLIEKPPFERSFTESRRRHALARLRRFPSHID